MGRKFVVLAALAAFMVSMSACKCPTPAASSSGGGGGDGSNKAAAGTASGGTVCLDGPSVAESDCTACYRSEADRDMGNLHDCSPHGGACGCSMKTLSCEERMPGTHRSGPKSHAPADHTCR